MREILFRGKRLDHGNWEEGYYSPKDLPAYDAEPVDMPCIIRESDLLWCKVDPDTVGQYTGLKDKNGKRIFEGDIINGLLLFGMNIKAVVAFKAGAFGLEWKRGNVTEFSAFTSICNVKYEAIGNIHDNPELIGGDTP